MVSERTLNTFKCIEMSVKFSYLSTDNHEVCCDFSLYRLNFCLVSSISKYLRLCSDIKLAVGLGCK